MNKAILMGRLTRDPEVRYSQNNLPVTNFTLAVNRRFPRQGEERQADFIPIVSFGKTAEFCEKYFRKGQQVLVVGRIQVRTWDDNEGKRRYITEVICEEAHFADSKHSDSGPRPDDFGYMPQSQDGPDNQFGDGSNMPYAPRQQGYGSGGGASYGSGSGAASPYGPGAQAFGGSGSQAPAGGRDAQAADDDGFMPIESENDLPF